MLASNGISQPAVADSDLTDGFGVSLITVGRAVLNSGNTCTATLIKTQKTKHPRVLQLSAISHNMKKPFSA